MCARIERLIIIILKKPSRRTLFKSFNVSDWNANARNSVAMTKIQRAKRKHGPTKDREEGEQYVFKKMTAENIHDTQIWEYTRYKKTGRHWDWRGINKELALASVWIRAIGTIGGLFFLITGLSCPGGPRQSRLIAYRSCMYLFLYFPSVLNALLLLFVPWHVSLWSSVTFTRWNQTISGCLEIPVYFYLRYW